MEDPAHVDAAHGGRTRVVADGPPGTSEPRARQAGARQGDDRGRERAVDELDDGQGHPEAVRRRRRTTGSASIGGSQKSRVSAAMRASSISTSDTPSVATTMALGELVGERA